MALRRGRRRFPRGSLALARAMLLPACGTSLPWIPPTRIPRIGYLGNDLAANPHLTEAFLAGLRERGWEDGRTVTIECRWSKADPERLREYAAELVGLEVDVIFPPNSAQAEAAHRATARIPIVFALNPDPVGFGHIASLAHPAGNMTGMAQPNLIALKILEQLVQAVPGLVRVAVLWEPTTPSHPPAVAMSREAAHVLGVQVMTYQAQTPVEFEAAFVDLVRDHCQAVLVMVGNPSFAYRARPAELALAHRLSSAFGAREYVEAGGLLSHAADYVDLMRRAAAYVDRILRGANPAELPVEQAQRFDFVINLKTAQALGLTIPPSILQQATEVIQ